MVTMREPSRSLTWDDLDFEYLTDSAALSSFVFYLQSGLRARAPELFPQK